MFFRVRLAMSKIIPRGFPAFYRATAENHGKPTAAQYGNSVEARLADGVLKIKHQPYLSFPLPEGEDKGEGNRLAPLPRFAWNLSRRPNGISLDRQRKRIAFNTPSRFSSISLILQVSDLVDATTGVSHDA